MGICTSILIEKIEALEKRVQELETKTESDLSQDSHFIGTGLDLNPTGEEPIQFDSASKLNKEFENEDGTYPPELIDSMLMNMPLTAGLEELKKKQVVAESAPSDCVWVARDANGELFLYKKKPKRGDYEFVNHSLEAYEEIPMEMFSQVTFENSPQKLVLESSALSKTETVEEGYEPTIDDCFYNREKENSEKPNNQEFDKERALEFIRDIERCTIDNSNSATKAILSSCMDLRRLLGGSDD